MKPHAPAYDRRFSDDDVGAVVDEKALADLGARVDIDSSRRMGDFGNHARQQRSAQSVQHMRHPMVDDGGDAGIANQDFVGAFCGGIADISGANVGFEHLPDSRQLLDKALDDAVGAFAILIAVGFATGCEFEFEADLREQRAHRHIQRMPDKKVDAALREIGIPQAVGKKARR